MRPSARLTAFAAATALALAVAVAAAAASPVRGGQRVSLTLDEAGAPAFFLVSAFGSPSPSFLPSAGCAFSPARSASLRAKVRGFEGPVLDETLQTRLVDLHARLDGTVADTSGSVYDVSGSFHGSGRTPPLAGVAFFGKGRVTISGPRGVVSGEATFVDVEAGPPEWDLYLTKIETCRIR